VYSALRAAAAAALFALPLAAQQDDPALIAKAKAIHAKAIKIDTHVDIDPSTMTDVKPNYVTGHAHQVDLPKMRNSGVDAVFFSIFVGQAQDFSDSGYAKARAGDVAKFEAVHYLAEKLAPDQIEIAYTAADVRRIRAKGKLVALMGVENGYGIGTDITNVKKFYDYGARYLSLTHNGHNQLSDSNTGESDNVWKWHGVSPLGKQVVAEANKYGIMLDISHPSKESNMWVMANSKAPVIASHSGVRALCKTASRDLDDEQLLALKKNGGVMQTVAFAGFVKCDPPSAERTAALNALSTEYGIPAAQAGRLGGGGGGRGAAIPSGVCGIGYDANAAPRGGGGGGPNMFQGLSTTVIRGGIGEFRGKAPTGLFTNALDATGLPGSESQLVCIGSATPIPDWSSMINDPAAIPSQCLGGVNSAPSVLSANKPNVTTFAPDFQAPRAWRASLGVQRRILQRYAINVDATYARGVNYYGVTDLNLNTSSPQFMLSNEGNRPVYVTPAAIVPYTGALQSLNSRVQSAYGDVYSVNSNLGSEAKQVTASINGFTPQGINMSLSYTYQRSRDQSTASGGSAGGLFRSPTTAGNPNVTPWGTSDNERRHNIQLTATWPVHPSVELTAVFQYTSGVPYTPLVGGDINGDGSSNDRAFIYNPASITDTAIATGMGKLLAAAPSRIRSCLESQLGQIAGRNSCTTAWQPNVSMQINYRPDRFGLKRNLMISFALTNPIAGADLLLHGQNNLQGWGQPARANSQLLYVTGFNAATNNFTYSVNEKFGDQRSNQLIITRPFQVQLTARYTIGPDYARQAQLAAQAAARGGRGGTAPTDTMVQYTRMVQRYVPNIFRTILTRADTLKLDLTASQVTLLTVLADSLVHQIDTLGLKVAAKMRSMGNNADQAAVQVQMRGIFGDAQELGARSIAQAQIILTKEQWAKLPDNVKHPMSVFGPIQGGGGRGGRPPG